MVEYYKGIDLLKIKKKVIHLENKLNNSDNIQKKDILNDLLSYHKLLFYISGKTENFYDKYSKYNVEIQKLIDDTTKNNIEIVNFIKENRILLRYISKNVNTLFNKDLLLKKKFNLTSIENNNILDILNQIYDKNFVNFIFKEIKENKIHFNTFLSSNNSENNYGGICVNVNNESYYIIEKISNNNYYYFNLFAFIHELSHGYMNSKYNKDFTSNPFREVYSYYNELKLNKFLIDNKLCYNDSLLQDTFFVEEILKLSNLLYIWTYLIDSIKNDGQIDEEKFDNILFENDFFISKILDCNLDEDDYFETIIYFLGYIVSLEQYYKYLNDPEKTEYSFNELYNSDKMSLKTSLNNLGISICNFTNGKQFKQYINDYSKRYCKSKY